MASQAQTQLRLVISADNSQLISATHTSETALQALQNQAAHPISNQFSTLQNQLQNVQVSGNTATQSLFNFNAQAGQPLYLNTQGLQANLSALNNLAQQTTLSFHGLQQQASQPLGNVTSEANNLNSALMGVAKQAVALLGAYQLISAGKKIVQDTAELEDFNTRLSTVTGSAQEFASAQEYLVDLAHRHHKAISDLSVGLLKTLTLEKSGLLVRKQSIELTEGLSNASSALGANSEQLGLVFYGLGQALASPKVEFDEIKQIMDPLPGLLQEVGKASGLGANGLKELSRQSKLTNDLFANFLIKALQQYDGAAEKTGNNLNAKFADIKTSYQELLIVLEKDINSGLTPFLEGIAASLKKLKEFATENKIGVIETVRLLKLESEYNTHKDNLSAIKQVETRDKKLSPELEKQKKYLTDELIATLKQINDILKDQDVGDLKEWHDKYLTELKQLIGGADSKTFAEMGRQQKEKTVSDFLVDAEKKYQTPKGLNAAIAKVESGLDQRAVSEDGAVGVMQVLPNKHPEFDASKLKNDAAYNIDAGTKYLAQLLKLFAGDLNKAIAAYNAGQGAVQRSGGIPAITETQNFVKNVLKNLEESKGLATGTLTNKLAAQENDRANKIQATASINEAAIDAELKNKTAATDVIIDNLKALKEQGKIGLNEYFSALTQAQQDIINAQIKANRAKLTEAQRDYSTKKDITKPEDLPTLEAGLTVKRTQLNAELNELQTKLNAIAPANIIDLNKELAKADKITEEVDSIGREGDYKNALGGIDAKDQDAQAQLELGKIDNLQLIDIQRQLKEQRYQLALEYQQKRLALAKDDAKEQAKINQELIAIQFAHIDTLKSFEAKAAIERKQRLESQFEPLGNAIDGMTQGILEGQQNQEQVIKRSLGNIALSYASSWVKKRALDAAGFAWEKTQAIAHWLWEESGFIRKETRKTLAKLWGEVFQTTTAAAGAKTREGIETAANAKSSIKMAWQAAQGAFSWVMKTVPAPLSWILAPAAGIAAFTGVMMLGSAKQGEKRVQQDGQLYELHKNESVLPADMADGLWKAVDIVNHYVKTPDAPYKQLATPNLNAQLTAAFASGKLAPALAYPQWTAQLSQKIQGTADGLAKDNLIAQQRRNEFTTVKNDSTTNNNSTTQNQSTSTASEVHEHYHFPSATFIAPHEWFNTMVTTQKQHLGATLGQMMRNQYGKKR